MNSSHKFLPLAGLLGAALLGGCANLPPMLGGGAAPPTSHPRADGAAPPTSHPRADVAAVAADPAQAGLKEGIALYNNGDFNGAIKRLGSADVSGGSKATQLAALKYSAFSYCVTSRQALCRQQFDKALKLDSSFDLEPGEHGHPLWGPVFTKAKKSK